MEICWQVRDCPPIRESFFELANRVFGLSFRDWYEQGFWSENYLPHTLTDGGRAVANLSVNRMQFLWQGCPRQYIQLGTVMTDPEYRGQGLARRLMETVLREWESRCDALYLFANDSVLNFYPKFGFIPVKEAFCSLPLSPQPCGRRRLDMKKETDRALLRACYRQGNPHSAFPFTDNFELLMFYCAFDLRENVFFLPQQNAAVILEQEGETLHCLDIYGGSGFRLQEILNAAAGPSARLAHLGFTPIETASAAFSTRKEEDETLFLLAGKENLFSCRSLMFPLLSHA